MHDNSTICHGRWPMGRWFLALLHIHHATLLCVFCTFMLRYCVFICALTHIYIYICHATLPGVLWHLRHAMLVCVHLRFHSDNGIGWKSKSKAVALTQRLQTRLPKLWKYLYAGVCGNPYRQLSQQTWRTLWKTLKNRSGKVLHDRPGSKNDSFIVGKR